MLTQLYKLLTLLLVGVATHLKLSSGHLTYKTTGHLALCAGAVTCVNCNAGTTPAQLQIKLTGPIISHLAGCAPGDCEALDGTTVVCNQVAGGGDFCEWDSAIVVIEGTCKFQLIVVLSLGQLDVFMNTAPSLTFNTNWSSALTTPTDCGFAGLVVPFAGSNNTGCYGDPTSTVAVTAI